MASFLVVFPAKLSKSALLLCSLMVVLAVSVSSHQFPVGGDGDWIKPTLPNMTFDAYNQWATRTRFRIGDTLFFKYEDGDSVLVVNSTDYLNCKATNPIDKFDDGKTVFRFDRSGLFYFISGQPGHCKSGQKLVIRVMHPSDTVSPAPAPSPDQSAGGGDGGGAIWVPPPMNSGTTKLSAVSCFMSFLFSTLVILYWFM